MPRLFLVVISLILLLASTQVRAAGIPETGFWFTFTPETEIDAYYDGMPLMSLCNSWKRHSDNDGRTGNTARIAIGSALERRGESPFLCQQMGFGN